MSRHSSPYPNSSSRIRRAARACDRCRASKLRCQAADASAEEKRCAHCAKMDLICRYTNPAPGHAASDTASGGIEAVAPLGQERLAKLEENVSKLLELVGSKAEQRMSVSNDHGNGQGNSDITFPRQQQLYTDYPTSQTHAHARPVNNPNPPFPPGVSPQRTEWNGWLPGVNDGLFLLSGAAPDQAVPSTSGPSSIYTTQAYNPPSLAVDLSRSTNTNYNASPNAPSDTAKSRASDRAHADDGQYTSAPARPLPVTAAASRMAAFTDPSSHEAPFRSITYNPDTYRNVEMEGETSAGKDDIPLSGSLGVGAGKEEQGGALYGKGDPIDRGIFMEQEARALFSFFQAEISFFLPVCEEPMSFDHVRRRSSFLLSAILAIATKYCCVITGPTRNEDFTDPFGLPSMPVIASLDRHGVTPVSEEKWLQIRALAMWGYFQVLISKVHYLEDVQATLLLCAWGLQDRGASPEPWLLSGSAYRLARRLGIHLAGSAVASTSQPSPRLVAGWKTYLCLYSFDRFLTVGFGRPETEGFDEATIDASQLVSFLHGNTHIPHCSPESAACIAAYVELANVARRYSRFVNVTLKANPSSCLSEMRSISHRLDAFAGRWISARSALSSKLGLSLRPIRMLYEHMRLCLHSVPLKPISHPDSQLFLQRVGLKGPNGPEILASCLKKAEHSATQIIQGFADDVRDENEATMCHAYDYAYMVLAHSAVTLLSLSNINVGANTGETAPQVRTDADRAAMRQCGTVMRVMVESNRSANLFPWDMALNLSLIARETGMNVADWTGESVLKTLESRASGVASEANILNADANAVAAVDFGMFADLDMFFQPGVFDDSNLFGGGF